MQVRIMHVFCCGVWNFPCVFFGSRAFLLGQRVSTLLLYILHALDMLFIGNLFLSHCRFRCGELHPLVSARLRLSIVVNIINLTCAVRCGSRTLIRAVSCLLLMFLLIGICLPRLENAVFLFSLLCFFSAGSICVKVFGLLNGATALFWSLQQPDAQPAALQPCMIPARQGY